MMLIVTSFLQVAVCTTILAIVVLQGFFKPVQVDLGIYGEKADYAIGPYKFPEWTGLARPLNALVNIGYVLVSIIWMTKTYRDESRGLVGTLHAYFAYTFGWMGILYGPIQFWRIVGQTHESAVMDQWVTLPFFAWVILWCRSFELGWNRTMVLIYVVTSLLSYNMMFFSEYGFEIALAIHAANSIATGFSTNKKYRCKGNDFAVFMLCLTFTNFVVFKLLDVHLSLYSSVFTKISGHFISKLLGDIALQHFAFQFFDNIARSQQAKQLAEKSKKRK